MKEKILRIIHFGFEKVQEQNRCICALEKICMDLGLSIQEHYIKVEVCR